MTKKEMFTAIRTALTEGNLATEEMIQFIDHQIELTNRPRGTSKKDEKKAKEQAAIKEKILGALFTSGAMTCGDLVKALASDGMEVSNQRVNAMLRQLKADGEVIRTEEKGKAYFSIPAETAPNEVEGD